MQCWDICGLGLEVEEVGRLSLDDRLDTHCEYLQRYDPHDFFTTSDMELRAIHLRASNLRIAR